MALDGFLIEILNKQSGPNPRTRVSELPTDLSKQQDYKTRCLMAYFSLIYFFYRQSSIFFIFYDFLSMLANFFRLWIFYYLLRFTYFLFLNLFFQAQIWLILYFWTLVFSMIKVKQSFKKVSADPPQRSEYKSHDITRCDLCGGYRGMLFRIDRHYLAIHSHPKVLYALQIKSRASLVSQPPTRVSSI